MTSATLIAPAELAPAHEISEPRSEYLCECGHGLDIFRGGRHRVYFELGDTRLVDPVMNRICPECGRGLPGKNRP